MIRRYSHYKTHEDIEKYVNIHYETMKNDDSIYINNRPRFIYTMIYNGIEYFNLLIKEKQIDKENK